MLIMSHIPTLRQLQYFVAVADHLSFSAAAAQCNVTQSTLSAGLNDLETLLGEKLFERTSRHVALTAVGGDLVEAARGILNDAAHFVQLAQRRRAPLSGPLVLGAIPTIAPYIFPRLLPRLQADYPDMDLQLREDTTANLLDALAQNRVDVVLMAFPYDTPGMEQNILWHEPFLLAAPAGRKPPPAPAKIEALQGEDVLLLDDGHCLRDHALAACRLRSPGQKKTFGATSLHTLIQMVQHGYGVTLLPAMAVDADHPPTGLSLTPFQSPDIGRDIGLCWRKSSPRADDFRLLGKKIESCATPR